MIIEQIIGSIKYYLGLDLAPSIIELLSRRMGNANVQFLTMEATHIHQLPRRSYTAVIMNSVIQYFPTEVPFFLSKRPLRPAQTHTHTLAHTLTHKHTYTARTIPLRNVHTLRPFTNCSFVRYTCLRSSRMLSS